MGSTNNFMNECSRVRALLLTACLSAAGQAFVMSGLVVPPAPEYGSTVTLEADYRLGRGEFIKKMKWYKDNKVFMSYAESPERFLDWATVPGVNVDVRPELLFSMSVGTVMRSATTPFINTYYLAVIFLVFFILLSS